MKFFIPHLASVPVAAEAEWRRYLESGSLQASSRKVYSLRHHHGGDRYEVTVGQPRQVYRRRTGPRGGYIKNAGQETYPQSTGTVVSGIIDAGQVILVWSYGPPFGGWANPSYIGREELTMIEYFEDEGPSLIPESGPVAIQSPGGAYLARAVGDFTDAIGGWTGTLTVEEVDDPTLLEARNRTAKLKVGELSIPVVIERVDGLKAHVRPSGPTSWS
jgi:hypothetical protein